MTLAWSGTSAAVILVVINMVIGLRPTPNSEREGLARRRTVLKGAP
jgi:ammonia channel protein AmtB